jgi:hypothetical protein
MILRRVIDHFRKQEWTAIGIDFMIVVIGVFVGIQVSNWNAERARRLADRQYLDRLHSETVELIGIREALIGPRRKNVEALATAAETIFSKGDVRPLSLMECASIHHSHVYTNPSSELPTVTELIASGRFDSLSSQTVRRTIQRYKQGVAAAEDIMDALNVGSVVLARQYPEMIRLNGAVRDDFGLVGATSTAEFCDVLAMRASQRFRNDLAINRDRFDIYFSRTLEAPQQMLIDLHDVLDHELGIVHDQGEEGATL